MKQFATKRGRKRDGERVGKAARKNYLVYIFFNIVHGAKQLSRGHKLSNPFIGANNAYGGSMMRQTTKKRNLSPEQLSWQNSVALAELRSTNGDKRSLSFGTIKTSGNNWINVKRDKSIAYRGLDLSKRGSHGEGVRNVL